MSARLLLRIGLALLIVANMAVAAAWLARDRLVAMGWLAPPPPARVDFPPQPLPPIIEAAASSTAAAPAPQEEPAGAQPAPEPAVPVSGCLAIGPYEDGDEARAVRARLTGLGVAARLVESSVAGEPDYVVYVQPADSRALAHRTWRELVNQSVDAYVIPAGDRENGVSVGVFTVRELAEAQRERVSGLGYTVLMQAVGRSHPVFRVLVQDPPTSALRDLPVAPCDDHVQTPEPTATVAEQPAIQ